MARIKSVDFLPEIFQTTTNQKFLGSTLDQLVQEPKLKPTQGYVGRRTGPGVTSDDTYIVEPDLTRSNYQLEPGIVFKDKNQKPTDALTYPGLIDGLKTKGAKVEDHERLFASEIYSWSPLFDFDKFVNYSQYYWLPSGPDPVDVGANEILLSNDFTVTRNTTDNEYDITDYAGSNPTMTLVRGGSYTFIVDQDAEFWLQSQPGIDGTLDWADNISSRDVLGVSNNGVSQGTITFNVPEIDAQDLYDQMTDVGPVDLATKLPFNEVNRKFLSELGDLNNIQNLDTKTIVFVDDTPGAADDLGWVIEALSDNTGYDSGTFDETIYLTTLQSRYQIWQINLVYDINGENPFIDLTPVQSVAQNERFTIQYGETYSNVSFYKNASGYFQEVPLITAPLDRLYYQDATNPNMVGIINIVNQENAATLYIDEILGKETYTSPNGVEFTNGMKVQFRGMVEPAEYADAEYYVEGVGISIKLLPVSNFVTPEPYTQSISDKFDESPYDTLGYDGSLNAPIEPDYITINKASQDLNAWTRSNRWTHIDVITKTAEYNNVVPVFDNDFRAKRPIIEFEANLQLFDFGTVGRKPVNIIDFQSDDALSNIHGKIGYAVDGYELQQDTRVIFAADLDENVRNKIYVVTKEDIDNSGTEVIVLTEADDYEVNENDSILSLNGLTHQGITYRFLDGMWVKAQQKDALNQAPLFDIFDSNGNSLADGNTYQSSTFRGSKLFSYALGTGTPDTELGFALQYLNIDNLGDIVFENNLYTDEFLYIQDSASITLPISDGFVYQYNTETDFTKQIGWTSRAETGHVPQVFNFDYANESLILDVVPRADLTIPAIRVFVDSQFLTADQYTVTVTDLNTIIDINTTIDIGAKVEVSIISDTVSDAGYYNVPRNLSQNVFNENTSQLTLGTIRNHYNNLAQNVLDLTGSINGANNIRDLGNVAKYGSIIIQHSAPLSLCAEFIRKDEYNFYDALKFNSRYYEKFKNQLIDWVEKNDIIDLTPSEIIERAVKEINAGKNIDGSFYFSDMLPIGQDYEDVIHEVTAISTDTFSTAYMHDFTKASTTAVLVYLNDELLTKDYDYTVATDGPRITILVPLTIGDILTFREYQSTVGSNVPNTPTKLGLYKKFRPEKFLDDTYVTPTEVIRGHDGSITVAFGDMRDDVLLEFERRIFSNIKVDSAIPLSEDDVTPGQFRTTGYTDLEITEILSSNLLTWLGWNRLDYRAQDYRADNNFTWNYSSSSNKLDTRYLKGHWRAIAKFFFDTDAPHTRPWEMLGLSEKPSWWTNQYGPAPYTSGNLVLWDDLAAGIIRDPNGAYVDERYVRPDLLQIIPVDGEGNLLSPMEYIVKGYTSYDFEKSWRIGDQGPVETAFRRSSAWPFAVQRLLSLTKPAQYFALMADRDRYVYNDELGQYLYDGRYRLDSRTLEVADGNTPKHSYINWIVDYNKHFGYNSTAQLTEELSNTDVNLCYRMASFSDKNKLKLFTDKSSPDSTNSSLLLPDESFTLLLYKNQPFSEIQYSSVIVQKVADGWSVYGNSTSDPYFTIYESIPNGNYRTYQVGRTSKTATTVRIAKDFSDTLAYIPYGQVFRSKPAVVDFLVSYGNYLQRVGLQFNSMETANQVDWTQMAREFVYWADQGWGEGSLINLNPSADTIEFEREQTVVGSLLELSVNNQPQDQNQFPIHPNDYVVDRIENNFKLTPINGKVCSYLGFALTSYEHLLILDNVSIFSDVIYAPVNGVRQNRIKISGYTTYDWNGQLDAQGFMLNDDNIQEWESTNTYPEGSIIKFKNSYWQAQTTIQPTVGFDFDNWIKIDYTDISTGLLANLATKSDQMIQFYNNKTANLESDADLLALGLTGFRPRDYMSGLDLDDISQVNIYSDMIRNKGTSNSLDMFRNVTLNGENTTYEIFENWAIHRAQYGATASRSYVELQLDEDLHTLNPTTIEVVQDADNDSNAAQTVALQQIYKQSEKNTSTDLFPVLQEKTTDIALPYAGFVNISDVDFGTFSLDSFADINAELDSIIDGTQIWVAKDTKHDWNVYRCSALSPELVGCVDTLDGTLTFEFNLAHKLVVGDIIVVKYFDATVDGTFQVTQVVSGLHVRVTGPLPDNQTSVENAVGTVFKLVPSRFNAPSAIAGTSFDNNLFWTGKVWIDSDLDRAAVYEKTVPFAASQSIPSPFINTTAAGRFGTAVAQGLNNTGALISDPVSSNGRGVVYFHPKDGNEYVFGYPLTLNNTPIANYGKAIAMGSKTAAIGVDSGDSTDGMVVIAMQGQGGWEEKQILTNADVTSYTSFGDTLAMSEDERWLYVGAPEESAVFVFRKVEHQIQSATFIGDGTNQIFDITDQLNVSNKLEIQVIIEGVVQDEADYTMTSPTEVVIATAPTAGANIIIQRRNEQSFVAGVDTVGPNTYRIDRLRTALGKHTFSVTVDGDLQRLHIDYDVNLTVLPREITFKPGHIPTVGAEIIARAHDYYASAGEIITTEVSFGSSLACSVDGEQVIVGAPAVNQLGNPGAGEAYIYDNVIERFVVTDENVMSYTANRQLRNRSVVYLNGQPLVNDVFNVGVQYDIISGHTIQLIDVELKVGDFIDVFVDALGPDSFERIQTLESKNPAEEGHFGSAVAMCRSKCSVYVGAPNDNAASRHSGSVTRFVNTARMYGFIQSTVQNPTVNIGDSIRINNIEVFFTNMTVEQAAADINAAYVPNVKASVVDGYLQIELIDKSLQSLASRLDVLPGVGSAYETDLGLAPYTLDQVVTAPSAEQHAGFGSVVEIDRNMNQLFVAAKNGSAQRLVSFDGRDTTFDGRTMRIIDDDAQSGVVYSYDLLRDETEFSAGKLVYGQQVYDSKLAELDEFGASISVIDGILIVGSPSFKEIDQSLVISADWDTITVDTINATTDVDYSNDVFVKSDDGRVAIFVNEDRELSWNSIRQELDRIDVQAFNSVFIYDNDTQKVNQYLDYIDPLNGKILGAARQNLDYVQQDDPAGYAGTLSQVLWGAEQVGEMWWDVSTCRFLDYYQEDINEASKLWGKTFPGSSIDVYEWTESSVPPSQYTGEGTPRNINEFVALSFVARNQTIETKYYFWVKGVKAINTNADKTLSAEAVASYIGAPNASGIAYAAFMKPNVISLVNSNAALDETNSILHVEYDRVPNDSKVFVEYDLFRENNADDFLSMGLYKKLQDSFCGADTLGNSVPDINLSISDRYGVNFRPRQSLFVDRQAALSSYIQKVNDYIVQFPIAESKIYPLLNAEDQPPAQNSGAYDEVVADSNELSYQNLSTLPAGYKFLVEVDYENSGLWSIYEVSTTKTLVLRQVQHYDTKQFWDYTDWYTSDFNALTKTDIVVEVYSELLSTTAEVGDIAKVTTNANGNWELYQYTVNGTWERVALQNGTIQFSAKLYDYSIGRFGFDQEVFDAQFFDQEPVTELRNIIRSINEEILIGDMAVERNVMLVSVFNYILSEQGAVEWLYKTSLIDVNHKVRSLLPYTVFQKDNQNYVIDYINESKPYHTKIKDFRLTYDGFDQFDGNVTDFDCPSYYDADFEQFISPILDDGAILVTDPSNKLSDDSIWQQTPWKDWYENYLLEFESVAVTNPGFGYITAPQVEVIGDAVEPAVLRAVINGIGQVSEIIVESPGRGYKSSPTIEITGGNGTGATAKAIMENNLVRTFDITMKFDRYEYQSNVVAWEDTTTRAVGDLVRYADKTYETLEANSDTTFVASKYQATNIETLSGVDRTYGFYVADVNNPGLDISLLIKGTAYPGVQVDGLGYLETGGFDATPYDSRPFDVSLDDSTLVDTIYESEYLDGYLGTRPTDINVDDTEYIDVYHSHAPEELVPCSIFDTLDIKVFSRPGADYTEDGHAYAFNSELYTISVLPQTLPFADISRYPVSIVVINSTTNRTLYENIDYTVDWNTETITLENNITVGDTVKVFVGEIGGGDQLHRHTIMGDELVNNNIQVPVNEPEIKEVVVFANGIRIHNLTLTSIDPYTTEIHFSDTFEDNEFITITVFGVESPYDPSYLQTDTFVAGQVTETLFNQAYFNTDVYSGGTVQPLDEFILPDGELSLMNQLNAIVEFNGKRLRPPEARRYFGTGVNVDFPVPSDGDIDQPSIAANEVMVFLDGELVPTDDYELSLPGDLTAFNIATFNNDSFYDPDQVPARYVTFNTPPPEYAVVNVYCTSEAEYSFNGAELILNTVTPTLGDVIAVTHYGDTRQLDIFTEVFAGPTSVEEAVIETWDTVGFDDVAFDLQTGQNVDVNVFGLDKINLTNEDRLWVTLNGGILNANDDYVIIDNNRLVLTGPVIGPTDIVAVTSQTENVVTNGVAFRIFKDMRDNVAMYTMSPSVETFLTQDVAADDDVIYVHDASKLPGPNLPRGEFGIVFINGERITYRERDVSLNTISGLRRGTAGTGAAEHTALDKVYGGSKNELVPWDYDKIWYAQGATTASDGRPLQEQTTVPALFIKQ